LSIRKLPDYHIKQKILYSDNTPPEILKDYGDLFFAGCSYSDAIDFYQKANFIEGLQKIKQSAMETGDVMLFQRVVKALNLEPSSTEWESIGQTAMGLKKYLFARHALEKANNDGLLSSLKQIIQAEEHEKI